VHDRLESGVQIVSCDTNVEAKERLSAIELRLAKIGSEIMAIQSTADQQWRGGGRAASEPRGCDGRPIQHGAVAAHRGARRRKFRSGWLLAGHDHCRSQRERWRSNAGQPGPAPAPTIPIFLLVLLLLHCFYVTCSCIRIDSVSPVLQEKGVLVSMH